MKWSKNEVNVAPDIVAFEKGVAAVLRIRCIEHRDVPQYNEAESARGECAACAVVTLERMVAHLARLYHDAEHAPEGSEDYTDCPELECVEACESIGIHVIELGPHVHTALCVGLIDFPDCGGERIPSPETPAESKAGSE